MTAYVIASLNSNYSSGGTIGYQHLNTPYNDDSRGVVRLAGGGPGGTNLIASKFKKVPSYNEALLNRVKRASDNSEVTTLQRGQNYFVDFTVENLGTTSQSGVVVGFYLSNDGYITSSDFMLGSLTFNMNAKTSIQTSAYLTIPSNAPTGSKYVGYVVDPYNSISESDNEDNRVHLNKPGGGSAFIVQ